MCSICFANSAAGSLLIFVQMQGAEQATRKSSQTNEIAGDTLASISMDENTKQALDIIRRKGPKLSLITITNDCVKGILEQLIEFAVDQSNNGRNQRLRQSIRVYAINCLGIISLTADKMSSKEKTLLISNEAKRLFRLTLNNHFPEITPPQIDALFKSIEEAGTICGSELTDAWFATSGAGC